MAYSHPFFNPNFQCKKLEFRDLKQGMLLRISEFQKLKANHNEVNQMDGDKLAVTNLRIPKVESKSQPVDLHFKFIYGCYESPNSKS